MIEIFGYIVIFVAILFLITSLLGLIRFPDFYSKVHSTSIADSFAIPLLLMGLGIVSNDLWIFSKFVLLVIFIIIIQPVSCHSITRAAWISGLKPLEMKDKDDDDQ